MRGVGMVTLEGEGRGGSACRRGDYACAGEEGMARRTVQALYAQSKPIPSFKLHLPRPDSAIRMSSRISRTALCSQTAVREPCKWLASVCEVCICQWKGKEKLLRRASALDMKKVQKTASALFFCWWRRATAARGGNTYYRHRPCFACAVVVNLWEYLAEAEAGIFVRARYGAYTASLELGWRCEYRGRGTGGLRNHNVGAGVHSLSGRKSRTVLARPDRKGWL
ncbi:hypothetical protein R3P38DRAFT_1552258 [Favolaschia claudopus]|uniref:Uncharacterized protein n=1 Tax=Favolaschia claudopus TaxID=2862362 RepID=A0AAW0AJT3_9AGAR